LVNAQSDLENKALAERLKQYGFTEEQIAAIQKKRRDAAGDEFTENIKKLESDKAYFDALAKIYKDDTLNQEQRAKAIEKLDADRTAKALANELAILKAKQVAGQEETKEYKERAAKIAEIEAQQAATSKQTTEKTEDEIRDAKQKTYDQAVELANSLADLAQALLELETARIEAEFEKRNEAQQDRTNKLLENDELTAEQRAEIERQNAVELAKIEEEKQAKLKEIKKKQADIDFAITVANIIAQTALAVASALKLLPPFNAIVAGLVTATGAVQIGVATAQRAAVQGLAMGGMVYGIGGPTDDLVPIMASNGEAVINAAAVRKFAPVLSAINESTGGAPIRPRFAAGGVVTANPGEVSVTNINDIAAVAGQSAVRAYILDADVTSQTVKNARLARQARIK
jgi:chemotaxis protein histidine kinase CheA